jgi:hypothetical protein
MNATPTKNAQKTQPAGIICQGARLGTDRSPASLSCAVAQAANKQKLHRASDF